MGGSALAALAFIWLVFPVTGTSATFGFLVSWFLSFVTIYALLCWKLHGTLAMKDRLATVVMWAGAVTALIPLVAVIAYVVIRGAPVAFAEFRTSSWRICRISRPLHR